MEEKEDVGDRNDEGMNTQKKIIIKKMKLSKEDRMG